jgi:hypothetical protein
MYAPFGEIEVSWFKKGIHHGPKYLIGPLGTKIYEKYLGNQVVERISYARDGSIDV